MSEVFTIPSHMVDDYWPALEPHLERFERETQTTTAENLRVELLGATMQCWGLKTGNDIDGVVLTQVYRTARGDICCIYAAAGTEQIKGDIKKLFAEIEKFARELGCVALEIIGRKGWQRVLPGFKQTAVKLEKPLTWDLH